MKNVKYILSILLFAGIVVWFAWTGVAPLFAKMNTSSMEQMFQGTVDKGEYVDGKVLFGSDEFVEVSHSVNFIPTGKEHFFLVFNEEMTKCVVVRGDKNWSEQFDEDGFSSSGVQVQGAVKDMDWELEKELNEMLQSFAAEGITITASSCYVDCLSDRYAYLTIAAIAVALAVAVGFFLLLKKGSQQSVLAKVLVVLMLVDVCLTMHILAMV